MNWRLLTEEEKATNKRGRNRRLKVRQKQGRREAMFQRLGGLLPTQDLLDSVLAPSEAFGLQYLTLQKAWAMESLIRLRLCRPSRPDSDDTVLPVDTPHSDIAAPVLHTSRRSLIFPWLVPPVRRGLSAGMSFANLMIEAESWKKNAWIDPYAILDRLHGFCGSWEKAAELELRLGLISTQITSETIAAIAAARAFWNVWSAGVHHYRVAVEAGLLQRMDGSNWACFDHPGLMELLPGVGLPRSVLRDFYIVRLDGPILWPDLRVILCSRNGSPLAIHPF